MWRLQDTLFDHGNAFNKYPSGYLTLPFLVYELQDKG
jgi:hypothetical protein